MIANAKIGWVKLWGPGIRLVTHSSQIRVNFLLGSESPGFTIIAGVGKGSSGRRIRYEILLFLECSMRASVALGVPQERCETS